MPVQIGCGQCGKKYRVDEKFMGKRIKCKNCGTGILVAGEVVAAKASGGGAAPGVKKAAPKAVRREGEVRRSVPQGEALDLPELPDLEGLGDVPTDAGVALESESVARDPGCPSCGNPFPAANRVCLNCGYHRGSGQRAKTQVEKSGGIVAYGSRGSDRDSGETRVWQAYENGFLNFLDNTIPRLAMVMFFGFGAAIVVAPTALMLSVGRFAPLLIVLLGLLTAFYMGLFYGVTLKVTMYGVTLAAKMFKFEVPEDGRARLMGMLMMASLCAVPVVVIGVFMAVAAGHAGGGDGAAAMLTMIFSFIIYVGVSFASFALLFHMKIIEAIPGYLLMIVFYFLGSLVSVGIIAVVGTVLKTVFAGALGK